MSFREHLGADAVLRPHAQRSVDLPPDNPLGVDPGPATFVAHGWVVLVQKLEPGEHLLTGTVTTDDGFTSPFRIAVTVVK